MELMYNFAHYTLKIVIKNIAVPMFFYKVAGLISYYWNSFGSSELTSRKESRRQGLLTEKNAVDWLYLTKNFSGTQA